MRPEQVKEDKFTNLDSWVPQSPFYALYEREILNKLLKKKPEEEKKQ